MRTTTTGAHLAALLQQLQDSRGRLEARGGEDLHDELHGRLALRVKLQNALADEVSHRARLEAEFELREAQLETVDQELSRGGDFAAQLRRQIELRRQWIDDEERFVASRREALDDLDKALQRRRQAQDRAAPGHRSASHDGIQPSPFAKRLESWAKEVGPALPALLGELGEHVEALSRDLDATDADESLGSRAAHQRRLRERLSIDESAPLGPALEARRGELLAHIEEQEQRENSAETSDIGVELRARQRAANWHRGEAEGAAIWRQLQQRAPAPSVADEDTARLDRWVSSSESTLRARIAELQWLQGERQGHQLWQALDPDKENADRR